MSAGSGRGCLAGLTADPPAWRRSRRLLRGQGRLQAENAGLTRELAKSQAVVESIENCKGSWNRSSLSGRGDSVEAAMSAAFVELRDVGLPARTACALIGRARAMHYGTSGARSWGLSRPVCRPAMPRH